MTEEGYDPEVFWDEWEKKCGHTGYDDQLLYNYDQPLRLRAIDKALSRLGIAGGNIHALDIGCGSGDIVALLQKRGFNVTGIDIGKEVIKLAKERFSGDANVELFCCRIEDMNFSQNSFDLVTGVTVLQHITDEKSFLTAVKKIVDVVTKGGGHLLILESAPIKRKKGETASFMKVRTRQDWIDIFERHGCKFVNEFYHPHIGVEACMVYNNIIKAILSGFRVYRKGMLANAKKSENNRLQFHYRLYRLGIGVILKISKPFDEHCIPIPPKYRRTRILIFQKLT